MVARKQSTIARKQADGSRSRAMVGGTIGWIRPADDSRKQAMKGSQNQSSVATTSQIVARKQWIAVDDSPASTVESPSAEADGPQARVEGG
jgi:hypothetical protein